jgi:hypothetical protein
MRNRVHSKILAIAAAVMIGMAITGGSALARGGGGFGGGHIGGFGGAHVGVLGGPHVGGLGTAHMGGLGIRPMVTPDISMHRGLDGHGLGHTRVSHELGHHHVRGLYGVPLYETNDCSLPDDLTIENCPTNPDAE